MDNYFDGNYYYKIRKKTFWQQLNTNLHQNLFNIYEKLLVQEFRKRGLLVGVQMAITQTKPILTRLLTSPVLLTLQIKKP